MRMCNIVFENFQQLENELKQHKIHNDSGENYFIQIFTSLDDKKIAKELVSFFDKELVCEVLLTQSGEEVIMMGDILVSKILISISCFQKSTLRSGYCPSNLSSEEIAKFFLEKIITNRTKLLVIFIACGSFYDKDVLAIIKKIAPDVRICGGRSHPVTFGTMVGLVGNNHNIYEDGLVCVGIDSDVLSVQNKHVFGWDSVGLPLKITKSKDNIVYEIDRQKPVDILRRFMGTMALDYILTTTYIFPLIYHVDGIPVARIVLEILEDGSVVLNDAIPEGIEVRFGFGLIENIQRETEEVYTDIPTNTEAIYMYSCVGRLMFAGREALKNTLKIFNSKPSAGFFTFGEIYSAKDYNIFLGLTNTFYCLTEGEFETSVVARKKIVNEVIPNKHVMVINTLSNLIYEVNREILQLNKEFEAYKNLINGMMLHIVTDPNLKILYVNDNLVKMSSYTLEEVVGTNCLEYVDSETSVEVEQNILPLLKRDGKWSGKLKQYKKDGSSYYVKMVVQAIKNDEGEVIRYLIGQLDDTDDELKRMALEDNAAFLKHSDEEKRHLLDQYRSIVDKNQSVFRLDLQRNFIYGNDIFLEMTGLKLDEILGKNIYEFIPKDEQWQFLKIGEDLIDKGYHEGVLQYTRRDGKKVYIRSAGNFIWDLNHNPIEIIATGVDITSVVDSVKEIEAIQKDVIYAMGTICEGKSRETGNHIIRVAEYSALLAKLYGCTREEQELLRITSPMHDIGKVGISDMILNKPGKLTPEEFEIMKTHTTIGEDIFKDSNRLILRTAGEIAGSHHEWWNGEGYPRGTKGEEIPLYGRITALADVFDALSNDRCYKKAWPLDEVLAHIKKLSGKQFQPELVELFLANIHQFLEISRAYQDVG